MKLERLLRFFHVDCLDVIASSVEEANRIDFLTNVDVTAADGFFTAFSHK